MRCCDLILEEVRRNHKKIFKKRNKQYRVSFIFSSLRSEMIIPGSIGPEKSETKREVYRFVHFHVRERWLSLLFVYSRVFLLRLEKTFISTRRRWVSVLDVKVNRDGRVLFLTFPIRLECVLNTHIHIYIYMPYHSTDRKSQFSRRQKSDAMISNSSVANVHEYNVMS